MSSSRRSLNEEETSACRFAQLFALAVVGKHRELRLGGAQRQLLALERHRGRQQRVLELVRLRGELRRDDPAFAGLEQAIQALALRLRRVRFCLPQRLQLFAREEVGVARDDLRLLRGLLLAHSDSARLLRALENVSAETRFVLRGRADRGDGHRRESIRSRRPARSGRRAWPGPPARMAWRGRRRRVRGRPA